MVNPQQPGHNLSEFLPQLILGTATFNSLYNVDPYVLGTTKIIERALDYGLSAFDTSPFYGPAEELLGEALEATYFARGVPRENIYILTKVGRIASASFDYSPEWIRFSIKRSLKRLKVHYLDVVYCHDVEFVSRQEVLTAVRELRRIRDEERTLKYVGISGFPIQVLCELAEMILRETGEPLDIVQTYGNCTLQNTLLISQGLDRFIEAKVNIVTNASPLGMGLLRRDGIPVGGMGEWHPAPAQLRELCREASDYVDRQSDKLETVALRYSLEHWANQGAKIGSSGDACADHGGTDTIPTLHKKVALGVSVVGVSRIEELESIMHEWKGIIEALNYEQKKGNKDDPVLNRRKKVFAIASDLRTIFGSEWYNRAWSSPPEGFVNQRGDFGVHEDEKDNDTL